jgi:hypothetical protein
MAVGQHFRPSKLPSLKNSVGQNCRRSKLPSVKMAVGQSCVGQKNWNHFDHLYWTIGLHDISNREDQIYDCDNIDSGDSIDSGDNIDTKQERLILQSDRKNRKPITKPKNIVCRNEQVAEVVILKFLTKFKSKFLSKKLANQPSFVHAIETHFAFNDACDVLEFFRFFISSYLYIFYICAGNCFGKINNLYAKIHICMHRLYLWKKIKMNNKS